MRTHRLNLDDVADDLDFLDVLLGTARDFQGHRRIDRAAHLVDRLVEGQALHGFAVDVGDDVARQNARLRGRRVVDRRDDLDQPVFLRDLDAQTAELALGLHLHVAEALGVHVARMGIERGQHAVDRRLDQFAFVGLLDIIGADFLEDVAEQIELAIGVGGGGARAAADKQTRLRAQSDRRRANRRAQNQIGNLAHHPRAFSMSVFAHHGPGSIAVPSFRSSI